MYKLGVFLEKGVDIYENKIKRGLKKLDEQMVIPLSG